ACSAVLSIKLDHYKIDPMAQTMDKAYFLYELWRQPILPSQRNYLILSLLDAITTERNRDVMLNKFNILCKKRFFLLPLAERQIISLIGTWKQMHIM
ncbi:MAG: hypothetical protein QME81_02275, partial [bacterium]|nr:hypothetical protein [bacterium]